MRLFSAPVALGCLAAACAAMPVMADEACDRACLAATLDQYLDAVVAHDPTQAPLSDDFRQTENAVVVPIGNGVWRSIGAMGALDRRYYDPVLGAAAYMGTVTHHVGTAGHEGERAVASLRIKVEGGAITEAEWQLAHASDAGIEGAPGDVLFDLDEIERNPPPERVVPVAERASRARLAGVANSYFDGITNASREIAWAHPGCSRSENGQVVTGRPLAEDRMWDGHEGRSDCLSGQGRFDVANVAARRVHVIDEEAQVVILSAVFIRTQDHPKWRNAFMDVMVIDDSRLRGLYATMFYVDPERAVPNWPPYEGNFAR
jgi:hypothetical protein